VDNLVLNGGLFTILLLDLVVFTDSLESFEGFFRIAHEIPDFNSVFGGATNPLIFGVESDLVDGSAGLDGSDGFLEVGDIPDLEVLVFSSGGQVLSVGGDGNTVDLAFVRLEAVSDLEVGVPDLEFSVPSYGGEVRLEGNLALLLELGRVSDAGNPIGVIVGFGGELVFSQGVPELDSSVGTGGDNLSVIGGEGDGVDFLGVTGESLDGLSSTEIPKSDGFVPRGG